MLAVDMHNTQNNTKIWMVSRHPGAIEWIKAQGVPVDYFVTHLTEAQYPTKDDIVIGSLPIHLVAELNAKGVRFFHIEVNIPAELRGKELTATQLKALGGSLQEYRAQMNTA